MKSKRKHQDPIVHAKHRGFLLARAQAKLRGEVFDLEEEIWFKIWTNDLWSKRGRNSDSMVITRINPNLPWTEKNIVIMNRMDSIVRGIKDYKKKRHANKSIQ